MTAYFQERLNMLRQTGSYRETRESTTDKIVNLSSNDYLGLLSNDELWHKFVDEYELSTSKMSSCSSRLLTGNSSEYGQLETTIASLYQTEGALVFNSGYHANIGILPALTDKHDLIVADKLVHASIIDGMRLCSAQILRYPHANYNKLEEILQKNRNLFRHIFIVTESIFSMDGDVADLLRLVEIKNRYKAFLYVDEAHALGVRGENGLGICEEYGVTKDIDFIVGTLGKALASTGAYVATKKVFRDYLVNHSRSLIFTTALPPINLAWSNFLLANMSSFKNKREHLNNVAQHLSAQLKVKFSSHIIPFITGSNQSAVSLSSELKEAGFYALPIRYPTVAKGTARLRFSLTANITKNDLTHLTKILNANKVDK